jgi:hypothetical protein
MGIIMPDTDSNISKKNYRLTGSNIIKENLNDYNGCKNKKGTITIDCSFFKGGGVRITFYLICYYIKQSMCHVV